MTESINRQRRILAGATGALSLVGMSAGTVALVQSMNPSAKALAAGGPVEVDISKLSIGQQMTMVWRQKPVWVLRRSDRMIESLKQSNPQLRDPQSKMGDQQPSFAQNAYRSIRPEIFVVVSLCTHLGCVPNYRPEVAPVDLGESWNGGYFCPCHGSRFDLAGRVYRGVPAPTNLVVPPYEFVSDTVVMVGAAVPA